MEKWLIHIEFFVLLTIIIGNFWFLNQKIDDRTQTKHDLYAMFLNILKENKSR